MTEIEWLEYLKQYIEEGASLIKTKNEDCAVIKLSSKNYVLLTTDSMVEGIHFNLRYFSFYELGVKLAVSNLSDIAACGGKPLWGLLTLGTPFPPEESWVKPFLEGLTDSLKKYGACLIGGDTVKSQVFFLGLTLVGKTNFPILRKGAKPGDLIFVSKKLGGSAAFLRLIKDLNKEQIPDEIKTAHLAPSPEVELGIKLSQYKLATSMIDISDGLILDLSRICKENEVGAEIYEKNLPIETHATLDEALFGGEDYALLFTIEEKNLKKLEKIEKSLKKKLYFIGRIIKEKNLYLIKDKQKLKIIPKGFDHFINKNCKKI